MRFAGHSSGCPRLVLVSAQTLLRQGLEQAMQVMGMPLLAALSPQEQVMRHLIALRPDVVLVDLDDPSGQVRRLWPEVMAALPDLLTLTLSAGSRASFGPWDRAVHLGPSVMLSELLDHVARLYRGEPAFAAEASGHLPEEIPLLIQDRELLLLLAQGLCNRDIALTLHLSEKTIRNRLSKTFARLHVTNRTQAAMCAVRLGLV